MIEELKNCGALLQTLDMPCTYDNMGKLLAVLNSLEKVIKQLEEENNAKGESDTVR